jgi:cystathionine gamma-lyase
LPSDKWGFGTRAVHSGEEPDLDSTGDVVSPIHLAATFARRDVEKPTAGFEYSRTGNPTRLALERRLASLEGAKHALAFSSGMAAEATLVITVLGKGDHVVAADDLYGGTRRLFERSLGRFGLEVTYADATSTESFRRAIKKNTRLVWLESPTNPLMKICDIRAISKIAKAAGALSVVDNTFASPYLQNPLNLGADLVVHSTTKYIGGHSDTVGGAIMTSNEEVFQNLKFNQNAVGAVPSPFDCFLVLRGSKTLHLRMERHSDNAQKIAEFLAGHPAVMKVHYPSLGTREQRALAARQMKKFGGMLSFEIKGGLREAKRFLGRLRVFALAESLGGVESLADHPALMTHASVPAKDRKRLGVGDNLIRLSVGIEDQEDLVADVKQAFGR